MDRTTVAWTGAGAPAAGERYPAARHERDWRAFLGSWQWGAMLVAACVVGLLAIFSAHPFASPSVSERVSDTLGRPAACTEVGATRLAGENAPIYKCTVGVQKRRLAQCFAVTGSDVRQLGGTRELGC